MNHKLSRASSLALPPELILEVFDEPIVCRRSFVELTGQIAAALILTYAVQATEKLTGPERSKGWFRRTTAEWKQETGLSDIELAQAKRRLIEVGLLNERRTVECGVHEYRIDPERLYELMERQANAHWSGKL